MPNWKRIFSKLILIVLLAAGMSLKPEQANGQNGIVVENAGVAVDFGRTITFTAKIKAPIPIQQVSLLFRGVDEEVTRVETLQLGEDGAVNFTYDASLNIIPPFSWIVFWYQATLDDGNTYTSSPISFQYNDDRFAWRENTRESVTVHWYAGDDAFGAAALDAAGAGMTEMSGIIPISLDKPLHIYIYSNVDDLKATLQFGGREWAGGHADPALGVVLVVIPPGASQSIEMETKIPHEIAHVMLYRSLGENYAKQPAWLLEGIASAVELYPNPEYAVALTSQQASLLSFEELCASFPADAGSAFLAYAQSQSFVTYIRNTYGNSGLTRLTDAYSDGYSCELGATTALGVPLSQLDKRWRETVLGQNVIGVAIRNLAPFIFLLALVLIVPLWGAIDFLGQRRKRGQPSK
jgi:hypothetical protein